MGVKIILGSKLMFYNKHLFRLRTLLVTSIVKTNNLREKRLVESASHVRLFLLFKYVTGTAP